MTYRFLDRNHAECSAWSMEKMVLDVNASGLYAWKCRKETRCSMENRALWEHIAGIQNRQRGWHGAPRIYWELKREGVCIGHNSLGRLMRANNLHCKPKKKYIGTTNSRHIEEVAPNPLDRRFALAEPKLYWGSDIRYPCTRLDRLYLCGILDLYERRVVGWWIRGDRKARTLSRPIGRFLFHSYWGGQYPRLHFHLENQSSVEMGSKRA